MGQLDEAIRQHLELKRAHGADEAELARKEQEALGPARREAAPAEEAEAEGAPEAEPVPEGPPAQEPVAAEPPVEPAVEEVAAPDASSLAPEPEAEVAPAEPVTAPEPDSSEWAAIDEPFADPPPSGNTPTQGFDALADDAEEAPAPAPAEGDPEDVLEETPEFLQDTPEHDKLWFEQKPPRDFKFDDEK